MSADWPTFGTPPLGVADSWQLEGELRQLTPGELRRAVHEARRAPDRRHGFRLRSADWRDPETLARVRPDLLPLVAQIADALDALEQRDGAPDRRLRERT